MAAHARSAFAVPSGFCVSRPVIASISPRVVPPAVTPAKTGSADGPVSTATSVISAR